MLSRAEAKKVNVRYRGDGVSVTQYKVAKGLLSGGFSEPHRIACPECAGLLTPSNPSCWFCKGRGGVDINVTVRWQTIQAIYAKAVDGLGCNPVNSAPDAARTAFEATYFMSTIVGWDGKDYFAKDPLAIKEAAMLNDWLTVWCTAWAMGAEHQPTGVEHNDST